MLGNKFSIETFDNSFFVKNVTDKMIPNCLVEVRNVFDHNVVFETTDFGPKETIKFKFIGNNFFDYWINDTLYTNIYSNHEKIYQKNVNEKTKCYVLYSNEKFEYLVEQLVIGLNNYSTADILHYTINYESNLDYPNLKNVRYDVSGDTKDGQYMQFIKPKVFLDVINLGYESAVFLDADIQVRPNIDDLFDYIKEIDDAPIFQKAAWDYTIVHGNYVPGPLLSDFMQLPKQKFPQGVTNILIFNKKHKSLFEEWETICFSDEIDEIRKTEFLHDELLLNCLLWKKNMKPKQFNFFLNVLSVEDVDFFYNHNVDYIDTIDMNEHGFGHLYQSFIPYDVQKIKGFHCVKDIGIASRINEYVFKHDNVRI
jgi:hypothetical protein